MLLLLVTTFDLYQQTSTFDFLLYDNNRYVTHNEDITELSFKGRSATHSTTPESTKPHGQQRCFTKRFHSAIN